MKTRTEIRFQVQGSTKDELEQRAKSVLAHLLDGDEAVAMEFEIHPLIQGMEGDRVNVWTAEVRAMT